MTSIRDIDKQKLIKECKFKTSRSGGSGGQHVNKVETKVELWFNISESLHLLDFEKQKLLVKYKNKLDKENNIHLIEQTERTQLKNKELLKEKFYKLIYLGLKTIKPRKQTKISKAAKKKRVENKKQLSEKKQLRRKI
ncbi:MAG: alternative ribosome rescue aminoacyl-tRNA hydrolase ArfB [Bacteroidota bacterium]|jgi:ribosome-associated protein